MQMIGDGRVVVDRLGVQTVLTMARSSTIFAVCGNSSLTQAPLSGRAAGT